ncbi:toll/interleukin-1 receptor domain-containing protein [Priestia megaterium]
MKQREAIFLSHSSNDFEIMHELAVYLEDKGLPCWYAPRDIPFGENYHTRIAKDIEIVQAVVVLITDNVETSKFVPKEIDLALRYSKPIIPIRIKGADLPKTLEFLLCNVQSMDVEAYLSQEEFLEQLAAVLEGLYQKEVETKILKKKPVVVENNTRSLLYKVSQSMIEKANDLFTPNNSLVTMEEVLNKHNVLYLHHPYHVGKYTNAVALLEGLEVEDIYEWSKQTTFSTMINHLVKQNTGFVMEIESYREFFADCLTENIEFYVEKLKRQNAYLILISKNEPEAVLAPYAVKADFPHDMKEVLIKHAKFSRERKEDINNVENWIRSQEAKDMLPITFLPRDSFQYINKINQLLNEEIDKGFFVQSMDINVKQRVESWFKEPRSLKEISFYLSLGAFEGSTYPTVIQQSDKLTHLFVDYLGKELIYEDELVGRDEYVASFYAHIKTNFRQSDVGMEKVRGLYFFFKEDINFIWEYFWTQFPRYHVPVIEWLRKAISERNSLVQENIACILVHLLKKDPALVRNTIIQSWANSPNPKERLFVVRVLTKLAQEEEFTNYVFNLIHSWANLQNNERLQWTAILLLGTEIGELYYSQSLRLLKKIYKVNKKQSFSIQRSFQKMSKSALQGLEYEKLYFGFWIEWFSEENSDKLSSTIKFAQSVFLNDPLLFFQTSDMWKQKFWSVFLYLAYSKRSLRQTTEVLIDRWVIVCSGNKHYEKKLSIVLTHLYEQQDSLNKDRLNYFFYKGLEEKKDYYHSIYKRFISDLRERKKI